MNEQITTRWVDGFKTTTVTGLALSSLPAFIAGLSDRVGGIRPLNVQLRIVSVQDRTYDTTRGVVTIAIDWLPDDPDSESLGGRESPGSIVLDTLTWMNF